MQNIIQDMVKRAQNFSLRDFGVFKVSLVVFGLWLATLFPLFITVNPRIYVIIWVATGAYLVGRMYRK